MKWAAFTVILFSMFAGLEATGGPRGQDSGLTWFSLKAKAKNSELPETLEAWYSFKNEQNYAVKIGKIETECGCLSLAADKRIYYPGESGVIIIEVSPEKKPLPKQEKVRVHINPIKSTETKPTVTTLTVDFIK